MGSIVSPHELASQGLFADAARQIDQGKDYSTGLCVFCAQLKAHSGSTTKAFELAKSLLKEPLSGVERAAIQRAPSTTEGRLDGAAKMLGLSWKEPYPQRQRLNLGL